MHEADIDQRHPGKAGGNEQQSGCDQFGRARSGGGRFDRVVVMAVIVMTVLVVDVGCMSVRALRIIMMLDLIAPKMEIRPARMAPSSGRKTIA
jgi:hypothetical protein